MKKPVEQLSLFAHEKAGSAHTWEIWIDGAARHNPGPAGAGVVIHKDGELYQATGFYLGKTTNNRAEYSALVFAIALVKKHMHAHDTLIIRSDSELLIKQIKGIYRVHDAILRAMHAQAISMLTGITYKALHVRREHNTQADSWANRAIDEKLALPSALAHLLPPGFHT